jgi:hypothetical protein
VLASTRSKVSQVPQRGPPPTTMPSPEQLSLPPAPTAVTVAEPEPEPEPECAPKPGLLFLPR